MQHNTTQSRKKVSVQSVNHQGGRFLAVLDSRKRKVRGLVQRNGNFYAQMRVTLPDGKSKAIRHPLTATRLDEAIKEAEKARTDKRSGEIHLPGHRPKFADLAQEYLASLDLSEESKQATRDKLKQSITRWVNHLGGVRVDWLTPAHISSFKESRYKAGTLRITTTGKVSARTVNLDIGAFNNAMRYAKKKGYITTLPDADREKEVKPPKARLLSKTEIDLLLKNASVSKNSKLLSLYIRFLAATGCREQEALRIRKVDADMQREVLTIGWDGDTKSGLQRDIQFNSSLRQLLTELLDALPEDTQWLFPSPQRGKKDIHAQSLRESFKLAREAAGLEWVGFHDFRHYFASQCVMAGIDFMTIAKWLGHQDGGILVAKVYGHLNDEHQREAAKKLKF